MTFWFRMRSLRVSGCTATEEGGKREGGGEGRSEIDKEGEGEVGRVTECREDENKGGREEKEILAPCPVYVRYKLNHQLQTL